MAETTKPGRAPHLWRSLRQGLREAWDALGLMIGASLTVFLVGFAAPLAAFQVLSPSPAGLLAAAALLILLGGPICAGLHLLCFRVLLRDEPSYGNIWSGFARLFAPAVGLAALQLGLSLLLLLSAVTYIARGGMGFMLLGIATGYLLLFWYLCMLYQWPVLVAGELRIIQRDDGTRPGLRSVLRNALLMAGSAPGYSAGVGAAIILLAVPLVLSGVGAALLGAGTLAMLTTQAAHDQFVRFSLLPEPPDPDAPVQDPGFRV